MKWISKTSDGVKKLQAAGLSVLRGGAWMGRKKYISIIPLNCQKNVYPDHSSDQTIPAVPCTVMLSVQCTFMEYVVARLNFYNPFQQQCGAGKLIHQGYFICLFIYFLIH